MLPSRLLGRLYFLFFIVVFEYSFCFAGRGPIPSHLQLSGNTVVPYGVIPLFACMVFLIFGHSRLKALQERIPFSRLWFAGHLICLAVVASFTMAAHGYAKFSWLLFDTFSYTKSAFYILATVLLALAFIPPRSWKGAIRATGQLWILSTIAGVAGCVLSTLVVSIWRATSTTQTGMIQRITVRAVKMILDLFTPDAFADPATFLIGTPRYSVIIAGGCSGVEGFGLVLLFTSLWLWVYRKETRFPQALMLIPCSLVCSWLMNILRLSALILIASAGGSDAFTVGFHAQFGWIAFVAIALGFSLAIQKISWMHKAPAFARTTVERTPEGRFVEVTGVSMGLGESSEHRGESPAIRAYLIPLLAILVVASASKLVSGYFDWLYPLRFVAAAVALFYFWPELKKLDWRFGWFGAVLGAGVFLMWIAPVWWTHQHAASPLGAELAALSPTARWAWIAFRVAAAVVTVPVVEELAFRGYLARRLVSREFDSVSFTAMTALAVALSSAVFGLEHMKDLMDWQHLILGTLAGLAFAAALRWRGRMGDAVAAHAISNLLLAAWVLGLGDWAQW